MPAGYRFASVNQKLDYYTNKGPHPRGCWEWTGPLTTYGYGNACAAGIPNLFAHREAWIRRNGPIPAGLCVLHECDNRKCVNPDHLWLGTKKQNNEDRDRKGRYASPQDRSRGRRRAGHCKVTERQVIAIFKDRRSHQRIADDYPVSRSMVQCIKAKPPKAYRWLLEREGLYP